MLQNAYLLAKIGADTTENERNVAEILPNNCDDGPGSRRTSTSACWSAYWLRRKGELAEITNNAKRAPYQSFSSPTHRSPLCKFSIGPEKRKSAYYTHKPAVFYPESGRCTPRETDRENQMRGTLIVHALHLMNYRTKSTTEVPEYLLKSKTKRKNEIYCRIALSSLEASLLLWPILRERSS